MKNVFFILAIILLSSFNVLAFSGSGQGTAKDPYQITNVYELQEMQDELGAHYILMNDIDATETKYWNDGEGFRPVGEFDLWGSNTSKSFKGSLDGQNYSIIDLAINNSDLARDYCGLFGALADNASVINLHIKNVYISGQQCGTVAGIIVADEEKSKTLIQNCTCSGNIYGHSSSGGLFGGILAYYGDVLVQNCFSSIDVKGRGAVGGFCGWNKAGFNIGQILIEKCGCTGSVTGGTSVGGFCGENDRKVTIKNCYAKGNVTGNYSEFCGIGGFVGCNTIQVSSKVPIYLIIENCYCSGSVSGNSLHKGGFCGRDQNEDDTTISINNCYWDKDKSKWLSSTSGTGKSTSAMKQQSTFNNWDFESIWSIDPNINDGYPYLQEPPIVSVDEELEKEDIYFSISPNPANESIRIETNFKILTLQIIDITGRIVKEINSKFANSMNSFPIDDLENGYYLVRINSSMQSLTKPLIISK
jgi:type IX secretion system substrate protein/GLUG motif-containing protein